MTRDVRERAGLHPADQEFLSIIETHGWHVTRVFNRKGDSGPEFAYSTGLFHSHSDPEILVTGLPLNHMHGIINNIGKLVKQGEHFVAGREYFDILEGYGCQFREVTRTHYRNYVGWAIWFYESDSFPLLQCFWPDVKGKYPWDPRCSAAVVAQQPQLFGNTQEKLT